jgi:hypothetical protein
MLWEIHTWPEDRQGACVAHVKVRCSGLRTMEDVSLDCGRGVHALDTEPLSRHEMNGFSKPIEGVFSVEPGTVHPEVILTWCDMGEVSQQRVALDALGHHHLRPRNLRKLLRTR